MKKQLTIAIIIAILFVGATGGGIYYWQSQKVKKQTEEKQKLEKEKTDLQKQLEDLKKEVEELKKSATKDETADWKTYTSTKYGYSVKYPKDWVYKSYGDGWLLGIAPDMKSLAPEGSDATSTIEIRSKGDLNLSAYINEKKSLLTNLKENAVKIDGLSATMMTGVIESALFAGVYSTETIFSKNGIIYDVSYLYGRDSNTHNTYLNTYNQILSTFKFTK